MAIISVVQSRKRRGAVTSPVWAIPANLTGRFTVSTDILLADLLNPAASVHLRAMVSPDGVSGWQEYAGFDWVGGPRVDRLGNPAGNPSFSINGAEIAGKFLQLVAEAPTQITIGLNLETSA